MAALRSRYGDHIFALWFLPSFFLLFSSPNLSRRRVDVYHTSTHGVANLRCRSEMCCMRSLEIQDAKNDAKNRHLGTIVQFCRAESSHIRHVSTIGKKLLNSYISSTRPHNMVNFRPLTAEIGSVVCGTPANFNGFHVLAALLHGTLVVGVSQPLRRSTEGANCIRQGGHHVGHWPTF